MDAEADLYNEIHHLTGALATLRQDVDALRHELSEVKGQLAEEVLRRRTLSSRVAIPDELASR